MPLNDWNEHKRDILKTLSRVERKIDRIEVELFQIQQGLAFNRGKTYAVSAFVAVIVSILATFGSRLI